jgi:5-methylcytosine-specific restriction protein A
MPSQWAHLYNSTRWQKLSKKQRKEQPLCANCLTQGRITSASKEQLVADHIIAHKGNLQLFYDYQNLQTLCHPCHNIKTNLEDGGFGRTGVKPKGHGADGLPTHDGHPWS